MKIPQFYLNKYLVTPFAKNRYYLSYVPKYKILWYRVAKNASRTLDEYFRSCDNGYVYSSEVGYIPGMFEFWTKIAVVRSPVERFLSCYKDKVVNHNLYNLKDRSLDGFINYAKTLDLNTCDEHLRYQSVLIDLDNVNHLFNIDDLADSMYRLSRGHNMPEFDNTIRLNRTGGYKCKEYQRLNIFKLYKKEYYTLPNLRFDI